MDFEALYYKERFHVVNPAGDVAIATLWSKVDSAIEILKKADIDLNPASSRIAVIANLYGDGLPQMLRNLLWNPQIRYIVITGKNLSGSREALINFFELGLEEIDFLGAKAFRIIGANKTIDGEVRPEHFKRKPEFRIFGDIGDPETLKGFQVFFDQLPEMDLRQLDRVEPPPIPSPEVTRYPSNARSHVIIRETPVEAYEELIFRLYRFGHRNIVAKKSGPEGRVEMQNVKVVVENPIEESNEILQKFGFSLEKFQSYQRRILDPEKPPDLGYTYGNRLRGYFRQSDNTLVDSLQIAGERLKEKPDSRHAYIVLWDNSRDLPEGTDCPCFVSAFFRKFEGKLTLTATFRSHNAMEAWPENLYGLISIQRFVSGLCGIPHGAITVVSHSISIDVASLEKARKIAEAKKYELRFDPNGEFTTTVDLEAGEIVATHALNGMTLKEYRGKTAEAVEMQIERDCAVSDTSHAMYVGRELAKREAELKAK